MELGVLLDAIVGALVGVLGVWAALGREHWFVRILAVAPLLLAPLLIPAHEIVFHHSLGVLLIALALGLYQQWRPWRWRYTSRTILLAIVPIATTAAVLVTAPRYEFRDWLGFLGIGSAIATGTLLCFWTVCGKVSWIRRLLVFVACVIMIPIGAHSLYAIYYDINRNWKATGGPLERFSAAEFFSTYYSKRWYVWWFQNYMLTAIVAALLALLLLSLARLGGWLRLPASSGQRTTSLQTRRWYSIGFVCLILGLSVFPGYVFYRLLTPEPYPIASHEHRQAFNQLTAIGEELDAIQITNIHVIHSGTPGEAKALFDKVGPILDRANPIIKQPGLVLAQYYLPQGGNEEDYKAFSVFFWLYYKHLYAARFGTIEEELDSLKSFMNCGRAFNHRATFDLDNLNFSELLAARCCNDLLPHIDQQQCQSLLKLLLDVDQHRASLATRVALQRKWDANYDWQSHMQLLLADWQGEKLYEAERDNYVSRVRRTRTMITQLALQSYYLSTSKLPATLGELVPEYLPEVPLDPICDEPLSYRRLWSGYELASHCDTDSTQKVFVTGPAGTYMWEQIKDHSLEGWHWLGEAIAAPH